MSRRIKLPTFKRPRVFGFGVCKAMAAADIVLAVAVVFIVLFTCLGILTIM